MSKSRKAKGRSQRTYNNKLKRLRKWYNHIEKYHQEKDALGNSKKPLKSFKYFVEKLKKSSTN